MNVASRPVASFLTAILTVLALMATVYTKQSSQAADASPTTQPAIERSQPIEHIVQF